MSAIEISCMVKELRRLNKMVESLNGEIETIQTRIKEEMTTRGVDTLSGDDYRITWKQVLTNRLDSKALKAAMPDLYSRFCKECASKRFVLS